MGQHLLTRATLPIVASSLLLFMLAVASAGYIHQMQSGQSTLLAQNVNSMRAAEQLEIGLLEIRNRLDRFLLSGDPDQLKAIDQIRQQTDHWLLVAERSASTEPEHEWMTRARQGYDHFLQELSSLRERPTERQTFDQVHRLIDRVLNEEVLPSTHAYLEFNAEMLQQVTESNQRLSTRIVIGLLALGICGAGGGLAAGLGFALRLRHSLFQLQVRLRDTAGKLNEVVGPVHVEAGQDLSDVERSLEYLREPISQVIERLQQSQRETLRAEQLAMVGQMAAGIAHEVRNPLMAIKLLVQTARDRGEAGVLRGRDLSVLEEETHRLEQLIRTFLDFARPPRLQKRLVELKEMVSHPLEVTANRAEAQGVTLYQNLPSEPLYVEADLGQMHQLLFNLLQNALESASEREAGMVELRAQHDSDGTGKGERLIIEVHDNGAGLPAEIRDQIFEPFVSSKETGLGLGLSICRRIVEAHGGSLCAADRPEGGAVFRVELPLAKFVAGKESSRAELTRRG